MARGKLNFTQISSGLLVPALLIAAGAAAYFGLLPKFKSVSAVRAQLAEKTAHASSEQASLDGVKGLVADLSAKREQLTLIDGALPSSPEIPELLGNLESLARQSGLAVSNIAIHLAQADERLSAEKPKVLGDNIGTLLVDFAVSGEYPQLKALILNIESNLRIIDIQSIVFNDASSESRSQNFTLQLKTYYQK